MKFVTKILIFGNTEDDFAYFHNVRHPGKCGETLERLSIESLTAAIYGQDDVHYAKDKSYPTSFVKGWSGKMLTHHRFSIISDNFFPTGLINAIQSVSPNVELEYYCEVESVCLCNVPRPENDTDCTKRMVYVPEEHNPYGEVTEAIRQLRSRRVPIVNPEIWIVQTAEREITPSYVQSFDKQVWTPNKQYSHMLLQADDRDKERYRDILSRFSINSDERHEDIQSRPQSIVEPTSKGLRCPAQAGESHLENKKAAVTNTANNDKQFLLIMGGIALILILMGLLAKCAG